MKFHKGGLVIGDTATVAVVVTEGEKFIRADGAVYQFKRSGEEFRWVYVGEGWDCFVSAD